MKIIIAEEAGFCFGVKRALELIERLNEKGQNTQVFGQLIHNQSVLNDLAQKGIKTITTFDELKPDHTLFIRTHGIPKETEENIKNRGIAYVDATCPFVKKIHHIVEKIDPGKTRIVIVGDRNHPEIIAAKSYTSDAIVVNSMAEAQAIAPGKPLAVVAQTTLNTGLFKEIVTALLDKAEKIEIHNTICNATRVRQDAIRKLAPQVDFVVVVGGKNSSNTRKLYEIALEKNKNTYFIEKSEDLNNQDFIEKIKHFQTVGLTAGASTPPGELDKIKEYFKKIKIDNIARR